MDISRSRRPVAWIFGVLAVGALLSTMLFAVVHRAEQREMNQRCAELVNARVARLEVTILRSMEVLHSVASLIHANGSVDRSHFRAFVEPALLRQPELQALSWNPVVALERRADFEKETSSEGSIAFQLQELRADGQFVNARARPEYVPVQFIEPLERNLPALGFDLNSDPCRREALARARDTGRSVATLPVRLAQGSPDQPGLLVLLPVYAGGSPGTVEQRRAALRGFAVAVFRVSTLVHEAFHELGTLGIQARLHDQSSTSSPIHGTASFVGGAEASLDVSGRRWVVVYAPASDWIASQSLGLSWVVLAAGLLFTLLATGYLYGGWRSTQEIARANAALKTEAGIRHKAEQAAASANQAKSDFLASMSHEIRTPLNAIMGYTQLMKRDVHATPEQRDAIYGIQTSGEHLLGLVNEVLDLAKIEAGRMDLQPMDFDLKSVADGLNATFKPLCAAKKIDFRTALDRFGQTQVRGVAGKLRQVLINLIGNAVKFTQAGEVHLHFRHKDDGRWLFEVIDTGLGIPEEEQQNVFKPFQQGSGTQHQGGTGLGLAIAQRQVELLGGTLQLESRRGVGSRFYFDIPLQTVDVPGSCEPESSQPRRDVSVVLPETLCARLTVAAELHSSTALKSALLELRQHGPEARVLAEQLRHHLRSFDMNAVQQLLLRSIVSRPEASPSSSHACVPAERTS